MKIPKARKLPSGNYCIELRLGGERYSITRQSEKECKQAAQLIKAEHLAGKREKKPEPVVLPTLTNAIDNYIAKRDNVLSPSTVAGYRNIQRNRFKGIMAKSISDLTDDDLIIAYNAEAEIVCGKTLQNAWGFLGSVLRTEAKREPPEVTKKQVVKNERPFFQPEEITAFIKAVKGMDIEIPALLGLMSLRKSEILALTWDNVDLKRKLIYVKGAAVAGERNTLVNKKENKNTTSNRVVPIMIDALTDALKAVKDKSGPVAPKAQNTMYKKINKLCEREGLTQVGVHGLRHSFASLAYHLGVPIRITMEIGGWKDYQTVVKIYTHLAKMDIGKNVSKMSAFFNGEKQDTETMPEAS